MKKTTVRIWVCKEEIRMKGTNEVAFELGGEYPEIDKQGSEIILLDKSGDNHYVDKEFLHKHFN